MKLELCGPQLSKLYGAPLSKPVRQCPESMEIINGRWNVKKWIFMMGNRSQLVMYTTLKNKTIKTTR